MRRVSPIGLGAVIAVMLALSQGTAEAQQGDPDSIPPGVVAVSRGDAGLPGAPGWLAVPGEGPDLRAPSELAPAHSPRPQPRDTWAIPEAHWDDHPRGRDWTLAVLAALRGPGAPLLRSAPRDIRAWCPGYLAATPSQRAAFWTGLVSVLAWQESGHDPRALGGGGQWVGLLQIAPGTARWRDCAVQGAEALMDGPANLRCAISILAVTVPRDGVIAEGMEGAAADWGPFHSGRKREEMRDWLRDQSCCAPPPPQMRPVMRPEVAPAGASAGADTRATERIAVQPVMRPDDADRMGAALDTRPDGGPA